MYILVFNAGSSSHKSCLYALPEDDLPLTPPEPIWTAQIDWSRGSAVIRTADKPQTLSGVTNLHSVLAALWQGPLEGRELSVVGHRVVHGGATYRQSVLITPAVQTEIERLSVFAPLHNPASLVGIAAIEERAPRTPQVAVFDTAFHTTLPLVAQVYPAPYAWFAQGWRRYGFHGISHEYCSRRAAQLLGIDLSETRLLSCHLGNGCSLAAVQAGQSIDTTMGFTPLEGLMMGTRSGSLDPGLLLYLLSQGVYTVAELDHILNLESGLKGLSGLSHDLRILEQAQGNAQAKLALGVFVHRLRSEMGAMLASLGGLDVLVFTAGIGEHSPEIRAQACAAFTFLGLRLDPEKNQNVREDQVISHPESRVQVLVIHTQEEWAIAQACHRLLKSA